MNTVSTLPISGNTKVVAIIADPIAHVQTPQLLNALFQQAGYDAVCVPMQVAAEDLASCIAALKTIKSISGAVITVPHKMATAQLCQHPGPQAQVMGAVNAIHFNAEREVVELDPREHDGDEEQRDRPAARDPHEVPDQFLGAVDEDRDPQYELDDRDQRGSSPSDSS